MVFFSTDGIPADVVGLGVLAAMALTGLEPLDRAFAGFGGDTFVMILGLLILVAALIRTGVVENVGQAILRRGRRSIPASGPEVRRGLHESHALRKE